MNDIFESIANVAARIVMRRRNRPVRSKSRWRKTLDKRNPNMEIVHADPRSPFMTVRFLPKTEEQRLEFEERSRVALATVGMVLPMTSYFLGAK